MDSKVKAHWANKQDLYLLFSIYIDGPGNKW